MKLLFLPTFLLFGSFILPTTTADNEGHRFLRTTAGDGSDRDEEKGLITRLELEDGEVAEFYEPQDGEIVFHLDTPPTATGGRVRRLMEGRDRPLDPVELYLHLTDGQQEPPEELRQAEQRMRIKTQDGRDPTLDPMQTEDYLSEPKEADEEHTRGERERDLEASGGGIWAEGGYPPDQFRSMFCGGTNLACLTSRTGDAYYQHYDLWLGSTVNLYSGSGFYHALYYLSCGWWCRWNFVIGHTVRLGHTSDIYAWGSQRGRLARITGAGGSYPDYYHWAVFEPF